MVSSELFKKFLSAIKWVLNYNKHYYYYYHYHYHYHSTTTNTNSTVRPFLCESHSVCQIFLYDCKLEPRRERRVNCLLPIHSVRMFHRLNESLHGNKIKYVNQDLLWHNLLYSGFRYDFENTYSPNVECLLSLAKLEKITVNLMFFPLILACEQLPTSNNSSLKTSAKALPF